MGEEETEEGKCHETAINLELNIEQFDNILIIQTPNRYLVYHFEKTCAIPLTIFTGFRQAKAS